MLDAIRGRCPVKRLVIASLAAALGFSWAGEAMAQRCSGEGAPVRGTVGYNLMFGAVNTNARVYGAASLLENHLLPLLEVAPAAATYTVTATPGVLELPVCTGAGTEMAQVDVSAGAFGAGVKAGPVTFFLSGSSAAHVIANNKANERAASPFLGAGFILGAPIGFYQRQFTRDDFSLTFDAIIGATLQSEDVGSVTVAYVGSKGLYTNLSQKHVDAFLGLVYRQATDTVKQGVEEKSQSLLDDIPYLRSGFSTLDWLVGDAVETVGSTSLYARRLRYEGIAPTSVGRDDLAEVETAATNLGTAHLEQYQLAEFIDLRLAGAWEPEPFLHEASLGVALGAALPEHILVERLTQDQIDAGEFFFGLRASAGVVQMPDTWYYGVEGGYRFRFAVDISMGGFEDGSYRLFFLSFGMNRAETLALFPYAKDAGFLNISGSFM